MMLTLHTNTAWTRLTKLAQSKRRGSAVVAVPFLGVGSARRLPLRRGDLLVTRFDDGSFKNGLVDPKEVIKYLRRSVEVHSVANLHAKVFVFGNRAVVGSTNVSEHSATHLIEAVCESDAAPFVAAATRFVKSLRGDQIGLKFARGKVGLFKPPKASGGGRKGHRRVPVQSLLSVVKLNTIYYDSLDEEVEEKGKISAREMLEAPNKFSIQTFRWTNDIPDGLRPGIRVMMCTKIGANRISVEAPARVLSIRKYRSPRGPRAMIFVETKKWARPRTLSALVRLVPGAAILRKIGSFREIRDPDLAFKLGHSWTRAR